MESEDLFEDSEEFISELDRDYETEVVTEVQEEAGDSTETPITTETPTTNGSVLPKSTTAPGTSDQESKLFHLPLTRIRNLMKLDPDLHIASNEAVFAVTRATELFIESVAREAYTYTAQAKKKTVQKRDVELAVSAVDSLMFLDGAMNF